MRKLSSPCLLGYQNCQDKFSEVAVSPNFRYFGNVEVGKDLQLSLLREHYDAILFAYGASKDKELGIPGEHLAGVYSARAFVGWYNGLPEYANLAPDLQTGERAVIIGQGNVALDVARILLSDVNRLKTTDITEEALEKLAKSTIREVTVIGRRGLFQASFTIKEVRELMHLDGVSFAPLEPEFLQDPQTKLPRTRKRMFDLFKKHEESSASLEFKPRITDKERSLSLRFMSSPTAFLNSAEAPDHLASVRLANNAYGDGEDPYSATAQIAAQWTQFDIDASLAFRSIGYKAQALPGMPDIGIQFDDRKGTIPNIGGRVIQDETPIPGLYCAGWVKRGPTGVIATTMEDAFATVELIVEDWTGKSSDRKGCEALKSHLSEAVDWNGWIRIDSAERERGRPLGRTREKFRSVHDMLSAVP